MSCTNTFTLRANAHLIISRQWPNRHDPKARIIIRYWLRVRHQVRDRRIV